MRDAPYRLFRSRARKSPENKVQTYKPCLHDHPRRAVDCAPYRLSAFLRLSGEGLEEMGLTESQQSNFCSGVLQTPLVFPCMGAARWSRKYGTTKPAVTDRRYRTQNVLERGGRTSSGERRHRFGPEISQACSAGATKQLCRNPHCGKSIDFILGRMLPAICAPEVCPAAAGLRYSRLGSLCQVKRVKNPCLVWGG